MIKLRMYFQVSVMTGLAFMFLISCDDKGPATSTSTKTSTSTADIQQVPEFDNFQAPTEIDFLRAKMFTNPEDFNNLSALGDLYFESARFVEAIQTYDKALVVNPMCADCLNDKGLALFYTGNAASALESFDKAIAIAPGFPNAWLSKGFVLVSEGRYEEAIDPLNTVKELDTTGRLSMTADKYLAKAREERPR